MNWLPRKFKKAVWGLLTLMITSTYSELATARGSYYSPLPDWMVSLLLIIGAAFLLMFSLVNAVGNWENKIYLKSVIWWVVAGLSCWFIFSQINWGDVLSFVLASGFLVVSLLLFSLGLFAIGFVLKVLVGIFFKPARDASTEEFTLGVASIVGLIGVSIVYMFTLASIFLGIPIFIISKLFGL